MNLTRTFVGLAIYVGIVIASCTVSAASQEVRLGLKIDQITGIDQKSENFSAVGTIRLEWMVPQLAFQSATGEPEEHTYTFNSFLKLLEERKLRWPIYSFFNQQGRADFETQIVSVRSDGLVRYFERVTATFQAPEFDFRLFPFDHQRFFVRIDSVFSDEYFHFVELPEFGGMGDKLGEEEWVVTDVQTHIGTQNDTGFATGSRYELAFSAKRHLNYYLLRILIPAILIVTVSWFTFFLQDYTKRIDLAGGNLLLFIAFNFTISNDLPRLGYLTLMDGFLAGIFIINSLVVLSNVWLRRLENHGKVDLARRLDVYAIAFYPLAYVLGCVAMFVHFF